MSRVRFRIEKVFINRRQLGDVSASPSISVAGQGGIVYMTKRSGASPTGRNGKCVRTQRRELVTVMAGRSYSRFGSRFPITAFVTVISL
jgi:hypothetical protein